MDYIVHYILEFLSGLTQVLLLYDIMCQYLKRMRQRFRESRYLNIPPGTRILGGIGQFHVHGHLPRCYPRFSLSFIHGAGIQDGEIIETLWNRINGIAGSSRGMGSAHRHELIDDMMNDSNWMKLTRIGKRPRNPSPAAFHLTTFLVPTLVRKWRRVRVELPVATEKFSELEKKTSEEDRAAWLANAVAADAGRDTDVEIMDMYSVEPTPRT